MAKAGSRAAGAAKSADTQERKLYVVRDGRTLRHDGELLQAGDTLELGAAQAAPLIAQAVLSEHVDATDAGE